MTQRSAKKPEGRGEGVLGIPSDPPDNSRKKSKHTEENDVPCV